MPGPDPLQDYRILLDTPAEQAKLGFDGYARSLAQIIEQSESRFSIGLFGPWGSGKTTLMNAIRKALGPSSVPVDFSAWRYEREPNLIVPLLDTLREGLQAWAKDHAGPDGKAAGKTADTVRRVIRGLIAGLSLSIGKEGVAHASLDLGKAMDAFEKPTAGPEAAALKAIPDRSLYHAAFRVLADAFEEFKRDTDGRIVVFVDDLDRCLPQGALEVMESMKLFFDLPGFVFVVGLDNRIVETSVEVRYRDFGGGSADGVRIRGADYLKKIFQVPFYLPPAKVADLNGFLESAIGEGKIGAIQAQELRTVVQPHLAYIVGPSGLNPREIKRYINAYTIARKFGPVLDQNALLAVQALSFRPDWEPLNRALLAYGEAFINAVREAITPGAAPAANAFADLDDDVVGVPPEFATYVSPGNPGAALLVVPNIRQYIATAVAGSVDPETLYAITDLAKMRRVLRPVADNGTPFDQAAFGEFSQAWGSAQKNLSPHSTTPQGRVIFADLAAIAQKVQAMPSEPGLDAATEQRRRDAVDARSQLQTLIRRLAASTQSGGQAAA